MVRTIRSHERNKTAPTAAPAGASKATTSRPKRAKLTQPNAPTTRRAAASAITRVAAIDSIKATAPVDAKLVARINDISARALASIGGQGKNCVLSVFNILDMLAPVAVALLPSAGDSPALAQSKKQNIDTMKSEFGCAHLGDAEFIHQLQVIHAQLLAYKGTITLGNSIAVDAGDKLRGDVSAAVKKAFDVEISSVAMKADPVGAAKEINAQIEKATAVYGPSRGGKAVKVKDGLKDAVKPDLLKNLSAASIATFTALLDWVVPFDPRETKKTTVTSADGATTQKEMMHLATGMRKKLGSETAHEQIKDMPAADHDGFVWVKLPYDDGRAGKAGSESKIYRIVGAPNTTATKRSEKLKGLIARLPQNDPVSIPLIKREGVVMMPRVESGSENDPFDLLEAAGMQPRKWAFPLLEGPPVQFSSGVHKAEIEDTEKGSIVQAVTVGGVVPQSFVMNGKPFALQCDVPYYNAIVVELRDANGKPVPLKVAEWTVEDFGATKAPSSNR